MHHEDEVRLIAYQIWEEQSCPEGRELEHWFKAEAVWQERQGQIQHTAKHQPSRTDLPAPRVTGARQQAGAAPRRLM
jgi:hypothetical protein